MSADLLDVAADVGSEEDEDYDEEIGENRNNDNGTNGHLDDSSEEEDDDDDEEAAAAVSFHIVVTLNCFCSGSDCLICKVREGFIVDEDEDEDEGRVRRKRDKKKRRRAEREEDEVILDEEDLDLIGENIPDLNRKESSQVGAQRLLSNNSLSTMVVQVQTAQKRT